MPPPPLASLSPVPHPQLTALSPTGCTTRAHIRASSAVSPAPWSRTAAAHSSSSAAAANSRAVAAGASAWMQPRSTRRAMDLGPAGQHGAAARQRGAAWEARGHLPPPQHPQTRHPQTTHPPDHRCSTASSSLSILRQGSWGWGQDGRPGERAHRGLQGASAAGTTARHSTLTRHHPHAPTAPS